MIGTKPKVPSGLLFALGCIGLLLLAGCEFTSSGPEKQEEAATAVPSADVKKVQAYQDASMIAKRGDGRQALVGGGESMNPVYGDNTMLVIHAIDFSKLRVGMTVVYLNKEGRRVAHTLLRKEARGWRAQGLNNPEPDAELVTPENLLGVVYASLSSEIKD